MLSKRGTKGAHVFVYLLYILFIYLLPQDLKWNSLYKNVHIPTLFSHLITINLTRQTVTWSLTQGNTIPAPPYQPVIYCRVPARWGLRRTTLVSGQRQDKGQGSLGSVTECNTYVKYLVRANLVINY